MSGISGVYSLDHSAVDKKLIQAMAEYQKYRGPDGQQIWTQRYIGLATSLLKTHDGCGVYGRSDTGDFHIAADARIDDRSTLIKRLNEASFSLGTQTSDSELILRAYQVWGPDCVNHFCGDFAFAIWDNTTQTLFCARDHFGIKPFYYAMKDQKFFFSNTMDCLLLSPSIQTELNEDMVAEYLLFGSNSDLHSTMYSDIKRLPPAHSLTCSREGVKTQRYWSKPIVQSLHYRNGADYVEHFRAIFFEAVSDRLTSSQIVLSLSGGMDSTSIAAAAKKVLNDKPDIDMRAVTILGRKSNDPEFGYSLLAAEHLEIPIELIYTDDMFLYQGWQTPSMATPFPSDNPLSYMSVLFWEKAGAARVSLGGSGGDALLSWPKNYFLDLVLEHKWMRVTGEFLHYFLRYGKVPPLRFRSTLKRKLGMIKRDPISALPVWLSPEFVSRCSLRDRWNDWHSKQARVAEQSHEPAFWLQDPLWPNYFEEQDPGATRLAAESNQPFFDMRLVNYISSIPPVPWLINKTILRTAMKGLLPREILSRPKTLAVSDRVVDLVQSGKGIHLKSVQFEGELDAFVISDRTLNFDQNVDEYNTYVNLRPFNFNYWLRSRKAFIASLETAKKARIMETGSAS